MTNLNEVDLAAYRASLQRELAEQRRQFGRMLAEDQEPNLPDRLDAVRRRIAEIKVKLGDMANEESVSDSDLV